MSTYDVEGGAARAAYRLHDGLRRVGVDSRMLVQYKASDDPWVYSPRGRLEKGLAAGRPFLDSVALTPFRRRTGDLFSPAVVPENVVTRANALDPDLIHLHWVCFGFLRIESLARFRRPIVWTLHDGWAFSGGCHYPAECTRYKRHCGRCPVLGSPWDRDLSHWVLRRKRAAWSGIDLTVVTPSRWLSDCARSSSVFKGRAVEVIPYGLDLERYAPVDRALSRKLLGIPADRKVVLYGAVGATKDPRKGFRYLIEALGALGKDWADRVTLVVFGGPKGVSERHGGLETLSVGRLQDDLSLSLLYGAADVFVAPSLQDNLPNTVLEAMACGTPCVAFEIGGMGDLVDRGVNGYLARPLDAGDLAKGIAWVLEDDERWHGLSASARRKAEAAFALEDVARRYEALYRDVLARGLKGGAPAPGERRQG